MALETVLRYVRGIPCCGLSCCIRGPRPPCPLAYAPARPAAAPCRNGVPQRRASRYPALVGLLTNISERNAFFISPLCCRRCQAETQTSRKSKRTRNTRVEFYERLRSKQLMKVCRSETNCWWRHLTSKLTNVAVKCLRLH